MSDSTAAHVEAATSTPVDAASAKAALGELGKIATGHKQTFGLNEARKMDLSEALRDVDPGHNKGPGWLRAEGWQNDKKTQDHLDNLKRHAQQQAVSGVAEISTKFGLDQKQLALKSLDELIQIAKDKGWNVDGTEAETTIDYLRNAWEYAKESQPQTPAAGEPEAKTAGEGIQNPSAARKALEILADRQHFQEQQTEGKRYEGGFNAAALENTAKELQKSTNPTEKALGFDFEIALLQQQLHDPNNAIEVQLREGRITSTQAEQARSQWRRQIEKLQETRDNTEAIKNEQNGVEKVIEILSQGETPEAQAKAKENPLDCFERKYNEGQKDQGKRQAFFDKLFSGIEGVTAEEKADLIKDMDKLANAVSADNAQQIFNERKSKFLKYGGGALAAFLLMAYIANKKNQGGQQ